MQLAGELCGDKTQIYIYIYIYIWCTRICQGIILIKVTVQTFFQVLQHGFSSICSGSQNINKFFPHIPQFQRRVDLPWRWILSRVWVPNLGTLPIIASVSFTNILYLFSCIYESVSCAYAFFLTCLSTCVAYFVFCSIFREREIMLFIGKPMGRSIMKFNYVCIVQPTKSLSISIPST